LPTHLVSPLTGKKRLRFYTKAHRLAAVSRTGTQFRARGDPLIAEETMGALRETEPAWNDRPVSE